MTTFSPPCVVRLLNACGPSNIAGLIIAVVINAVQASTARPASYVSKEVRKRLTPPVANGNATATIITPSFSPWVVATVFHVLPDAVFGGCMKRPADDRAVLQPSLGRQFPRKAATAFAVARRERRSPYHLLGAAFASAQKVILLAVPWAAMQHREATKFGICIHAGNIAKYKDMFQPRLEAVHA